MFIDQQAFREHLTNQQIADQMLRLDQERRTYERTGNWAAARRATREIDRLVERLV